MKMHPLQAACLRVLFSNRYCNTRGSMNASVPVKTYAAELCGFMCLQSPAAYSVIGIVRTEVSLLGGPITILVRAFCDALVSPAAFAASLTILIALSLVETYSQRNAQSSPIPDACTQRQQDTKSAWIQILLQI